MPKLIDLTGERFGRLLVLREGDRVRQRRAWWCRCDCGTERLFPSATLRHDGVRSCGCLRKETSAATAAQRKTAQPRRDDPLYHRWSCIIQRCENPKNPSYHNYGGRGVKICAEWRASFNAFLADMGPPPTPQHTLDRIDNTGNYAPDNCRWVLPAVQLRNSRRNISLNIGDLTLTAKDWAILTGIDYQRLTRAYRRKGADAAVEMLESAPVFRPRGSGLLAGTIAETEVTQLMSKPHHHAQLLMANIELG